MHPLQSQTLDRAAFPINPPTHSYHISPYARKACLSLKRKVDWNRIPFTPIRYARSSTGVLGHRTAASSERARGQTGACAARLRPLEGVPLTSNCVIATHSTVRGTRRDWSDRCFGAHRRATGDWGGARIKARLVRLVCLVLINARLRRD